MTREPHFIDATTGHYMPTSVIYFDSETDFIKTGVTRKELRMKLAVLEHWRYFKARGWRQQSELVTYDAQDIPDYITRCVRSRSTTYLFAHNVQFDLLVSGLLKTLPQAGWKMDSFYFKGMVSIFEWRKDTRKLIALDTANYFQGSLADIGETLGVPKMPIDFETADDSYLLEYCRNDVKILVKIMFAWLDFLQENDLGSFKRTLASTSFNIWRYKFLKHKVFVHNDSEVLRLEDDSYHGGRVEMFKRGCFTGDTYYRLDVNAMYPSIMAKEKFPVSLYGFKLGMKVEKLQEKLTKYAVIADCEVETEEPAFPVRTDDAIIYPVGSFRAVLSTPELKLLLDCGVIKHIYMAAWYQQQPIFSEYMLYLYDLRMKYRSEGNKPYDKMAKILANSAYGKLAQKGIKTEYLEHQKGKECDVEHFWDCDKHYHYKRVHLCGQVFEQRPGGYAYHSFPAISSHVTAYGRIALYNLLRRAGRENVYHVDTDGLIVNSKGYSRLKHLIDPLALGSLKIEEICKWVEVKAPKHYITPTVEKIKGIADKAQELTWDMYEQDQFAGINTMLSRGDLTAVHVDRIVKLLNFPVKSGLLQSDGSILPFRLPR